MAAAKTQTFFELLAQSKLVNAQQLAGIPREGDPKGVAAALVERGELTAWQAQQLLSGRNTFHLGKYRLLGKLSQGGTEVVYLGEHILMRRRVAIKVLPARLVKDSACLERFQREAQTIASVDHPNIIQAFSVDNEGDLHYIVMQHVEGRNLEQIVGETGPLEPAQAAKYIRQAADGLAHAHSRGLIHRDINPSNLIVDSQDTIRIRNLGLARLTGDEVGSQAVVGATDYLAPEQATGGRDMDGQGDIYSLGCTLYYLLTGHPPFPDGTFTERMLKHRIETPPPITAERPNVPEALANICYRMLAKKPAVRYPSAGAVSEALLECCPPPPVERIVAEPEPAAEPLVQKPPRNAPPLIVRTTAENSSFTRGRSPRPARKRHPAVIPAVVVAVLAIAAGAMWGINRAKAPVSPPVTQIASKTPAAKRTRPFAATEKDRKPLARVPAAKSADLPAMAPIALAKEPPRVVDLTRSQVVFTQVEEARDYTLVYLLKIPETAKFNTAGLTYTVDNRKEIRPPFDRVAYYLELQQKGGELQFAYASFDAVTQDLDQIGVPHSGTSTRLQLPVKNLNVQSNVAGVSSGAGLTGGIEFWDQNYGAGNAAKVPGASDKTYDFGDQMSPGNYGSMQVHNLDAKQTVLAYNNWGGNNGEAGIGNQPKGNQPKWNPDWTFSNNIKQYVVKNLYVLVRLPKSAP